MAVGATHPDYDAALATWSRARDVLAGEDAVKGAGTRYLPRLDSQSEEEYAAYKARASFFGATARTLEDYLDLIFRRAPVTKAGELLKVFLCDCDRRGTEFVQYARRVVSEVLSVGDGVVECLSAGGVGVSRHQCAGGAGFEYSVSVFDDEFGGRAADRNRAASGFL
jgi:hypothetical protein